MKFEQWTNQQGRRIETDAEIDAAMSTWMEAEFYKKEVLRAWESGYSVLGWTSSLAFGKHGARKLPNTWRSLQGWQRLSPCGSRKPWVRAVWSGIACRLTEQGQPAMGLVVMTGLLSYARPEKLLRMRQCDLVPPLRVDLAKLLDHSRCRRDRQAYKGADVERHTRARWPLARKLAPFWAALRGRGSQRPLWPFDYPIFCRSFQRAVADLTLPPLLPYQWRHSGSSIDIADRARSLEQCQETGTVAGHEDRPAPRKTANSPLCCNCSGTEAFRPWCLPHSRVASAMCNGSLNRSSRVERNTSGCNWNSGAAGDL